MRTKEEFHLVVDFLKDKETISVLGLRRKFDKTYKWAMDMMDKLEEEGIVECFNGEKDRIVIK